MANGDVEATAAVVPGATLDLARGWRRGVVVAVSQLGQRHLLQLVQGMNRPCRGRIPKLPGTWRTHLPKRAALLAAG